MRMPGVNPFTAMAVLYVTAGLFFAVLKGLEVLPVSVGPSNLNWLRVHLITIGTISQVVFASLPGILGRKLNVGNRPAREGWIQWGLLNGGFLLIVVGLVGTDSWTASIGASLVFVAVYRLLNGVLQAMKQSGRRWRESLRFYATAPVYLMVGVTMAVSLLFAWWAPGGRMGTLEAHVHANVWGFLALIVAGMLFDLFPALAGGPMARPAWIGPIYWLLNLGAAGLVVGPWVNHHAITVAGLATYFTGTATLILNLVLTLRTSRSAPPAAMHTLLAYLWMIVPAFFAPFIVLTPDRVNGPAIEAAATQGLINGWVMGMVMGALPRLLRTRGWRTDSSLLTDTSRQHDGCWLTVITLNVGVALVWGTALAPAGLPVQVLTLGGYGLIAVAWLAFLIRTWRYFTAEPHQQQKSGQAPA